ncbi:hypothetical protein [Montanilutibacter psychrotolerans]|uniref:hypothetical protein n=1 Tax=Montanilutibacter psychrotolerans TaxID=1327343 RepID=UPI0011CD3B98|nr:hypothetical protein [Lysobacter psychrotolerans]
MKTNLARLLVLTWALLAAACDMAPPADRLVDIVGFDLSEAKLVEKEYRSSRLGAEGLRLLIYEFDPGTQRGTDPCTRAGYREANAASVLKRYPALQPYVDVNGAAVCVRRSSSARAGVAVLQGDTVAVLIFI